MTRRTLIRGIGELFTGDLAAPLVPAKSIAIADGRIAGFDPPSEDGFDVVIDAAGAAVVPGLIDGHVHPVAGEYTPTQDAIGWISNYLHGGTTTMLSAGELHTPGLDYGALTPELVTALATVNAATYGSQRWGGVKVHAGTALLIPGMTEAHFDRLAAAGARLVKFLFYPFAADPDEARRYVRWARERGIRSKVHTGGVSRSGVSQICGFETLAWLDPDIAAHISGGPIPMSDADLDRVIDETAFPLEICSSGNYGATLRAVRRLAERGRLDRLTLGSDTPGGTGVIPRGMWRNILFLASVCGVPAAEAVAIATGNTGRAHGLAEGVLAPGRPADLAICGPVEGSAGSSLADAIGHGDLPGISHVLIDGELVVSGRSRQTPPPRLRPVIVCCGR
ncbi:MAG: amidohydrolase family protein [Lautropia sp.]